MRPSKELHWKAIPLRFIAAGGLEGLPPRAPEWRISEDIMEELFDENQIVPFLGTRQDLEDLTALVQNCLTVLRQAASLREMVLETWLTVDYSIRKLLLSGFELTRFCDEELDLQYRLLPRDFQSLIDLLEYTGSHCRSLPLDQEPRKPDKVGGFCSSMEFLRFVGEHDPELLQRIQGVEQQFRVEKNPDLIGGDRASALLPDQGPRTERIKLGWRRVACGLDSDWFVRARQLNKARNVAAHSLRVQEIAKALGLSGPKATVLARDKCFQILQALLGLRDEAIYS